MLDKIDFIVDIVIKILQAIIMLLPLSPFQKMTDAIESFDFLGFLNYFIPFDVCLTMLEVWLAAVAIYYIVKNLDKILEFVKKIF
ncbi:hypothetical protein GKG47_20135 [Lactonifactor sp. BIOML-A3]|uniref:hypothetical protein n=1 Tax=unclassified Lactonifactor TaxID=2636670 RepID=UPI0012B05933|nr:MULTISPECIES: hypothetical protein [unclassified Lactonifactor]MSA03716.1 hypothetical protein [Lactonifactor sp. BIOML-A5]MSA10173.1 hypothetical protein [Lactonifactor sp. BIOML-A4]MSA14723.1 hypothetical protein [Lactonifactor sp. BIOML-A3]MSA19145.1 hypothetical protein [Lactonifactor sp. BIOML-A2]MSA39819.1 hypothetical protein [Lactonifactor sp. BIOML-A1]